MDPQAMNPQVMHPEAAHSHRTGTTLPQAADGKVMDRIHRQLAAFDQLPSAPELIRIIRQEAGLISDLEVAQILRRIHDDRRGFGALEQILLMPGLTDVVVNGCEQLYYDCGAGLTPGPALFPDDHAVRALASRLAVQGGRRLDEAHPFCDTRLEREDGTIVRVHAMLSPPATQGTLLSLRVLRQAATTLDVLVAHGAFDEELAGLLRQIVIQRTPFLVVGGTGAGKTTLLSAMLAEIPAAERLMCIEDSPELAPNHQHLVSLVTREANSDNAGAITLEQLVRQALRMRPDRIVVGEIRGAEIIELIAALNTGHEGGAATIHANSLADVPARMEALAALGGMDPRTLHSQLAATHMLAIVVQRTGHQRRIAEIGDLAHLKAGRIQPITLWRRGEDTAALRSHLNQLAGGRAGAGDEAP